MICELRIGVSNDGFRVYSGIKCEHCMYSFLRAFRAVCGPGTDDCRLDHALLRIQRPFHVVRKDIQSFRRHDHFLLAPADEQTSFRILLADVPGVQPTVVVSRSPCSLIPDP